MMYIVLIIYIVHIMVNNIVTVCYVVCFNRYCFRNFDEETEIQYFSFGYNKLNTYNFHNAQHACFFLFLNLRLR